MVRKQTSEPGCSPLLMRQGIAYLQCPPGTRVDLNFVQWLIRTQLRTLQGRACPLLIDMDTIAGIDKGARDYLARYARLLFRAVAILARGRVAEAASRFYVSVSRPGLPARIFSDGAAAAAFLQCYL